MLLNKKKTNTLLKNYNNLGHIVYGMIIAIFFSTFSMGMSDIDAVIGKVAFVMLFCFSVLLFVRTDDLSKLNRIILFLLIIFSCIKLFNISFQTIKSIVQICIIFAILEGISVTIIDKKFCKLFSLLYLMFCCFGIVSFLLSKDKNYFIFFGSTNTFAGIFLFMFLCSIILNQINKNNFLFILNGITTLFFLILMHSRTAQLTLILVFCVYFVMKIFCNSYNKSLIFFFFFLLMMCLALAIYINITKFPFYNFINEISVKLFNKNIDSGRPGLWKSLLQDLNFSNAFIGRGGLNLVSGSSAHNQFIQIIIESGFIGLVVFLVILVLIWNRYAKFYDDKIIKYCMAIFIAIIIYNCFETSLIQNKFAIGCFEWMIIAFGLERANILERLKYTQNVGNYNKYKLGEVNNEKKGISYRK